MGGSAHVNINNKNVLLLETDNFYKCSFKDSNNVSYRSAEEYYQLQKCTTDLQRKKIRKAGPGIGCWEAAKHFKLPKSFHKTKVKKDKCIKHYVMRM